MIDSYRFGRIVIDGEEYTSDVIVYQDRVDGGWWRREGHTLRKEDLKDVLEGSPRLLIIGTGAYGRMKVPDETRRFIESRGIELQILKTGEACEAYNRLPDKEGAVAALHLTC
ncbi:MAG: hypothetical protein D6733_03165 [Methanobacteriota archaeon]|nr:MAG: hypothetical protein D6733_03165 [Euryarchaeota archaeon]